MDVEEKEETPREEKKEEKKEVEKPEGAPNEDTKSDRAGDAPTKIDLVRLNEDMKKQAELIKSMDRTIQEQKRQMAEMELWGKGYAGGEAKKDTRSPEQFAQDFLEGKMGNILEPA